MSEQVWWKNKGQEVGRAYQLPTPLPPECCWVKLFGGNFFDTFTRVLFGDVVDQNVELTQFVDGALLGRELLLLFCHAYPRFLALATTLQAAFCMCEYSNRYAWF